MTVLSEVLVDGRLPEDFQAKQHGLVFSQDVYDLLMAAQSDSLQHRIAPVATTDNRWLCCADILTEAMSGVYAPIFSKIPPETAELVEVLAWEYAEAILPKPDPLELEAEVVPEPEPLPEPTPDPEV